jgi:hypothetical protein
MKIRKWQPRVEALESRWVPALLLTLDSAGNLTTIFGVPDGDVDLTWTADDEVNVVEDGNDLGTYSVSGDLRADLGNSVAAVTVTADLATFAMSGNLSIRTGNSLGGYRVILEDGTVSGNVSIKTGAGDDTVRVGIVDAVTISGSLTIDGGAGTDSGGFGPTGSVIEGNVTATGFQDFFSDQPFDIAGNLTVDSSREGLDASIRMGVNVAGNAVIRTGAGDDLVRFNEDSVISGNLIVNTKGGDDDLQLGTGILTPGTTTVLGNLVVNSGGGADTLQLGGDGCDVNGNVTMTTGSGDDTVIFEAATTVLGSAITLVMGNGDDTMVNVDLTAPGARLTFLGQNGDDTVDWSAAIPDLASAYLDGGFGANVFDGTGGVIDFPFTLRNFV